MPNIELSIHVITLLGIVFLATLIGYSLRTSQTRKKQLKIQQLRKEITNNHALILEQQKEYVALELQMKNVMQTPVLPLKSTVSEYPEGYYRILENPGEFARR